jgi:hypothetical protein
VCFQFDWSWHLFIPKVLDFGHQILLLLETGSEQHALCKHPLVALLKVMKVCILMLVYIKIMRGKIMKQCASHFGFR